jgi:hypothetical protein
MAKYGAKAQESVAREMKAMEAGKLRSGTGAKVTSRKQAVAIGLSEARKEGAKMPPPPKKHATKSGTKTGTKKAVAKKTATKKTAAKKTSAKKAPGKKAATKKSAAKKSVKKAAKK